MWQVRHVLGVVMMMYSVTPLLTEAVHMLSSPVLDTFQVGSPLCVQMAALITKHTTHVVDETTINKIERLASQLMSRMRPQLIK